MMAMWCLAVLSVLLGVGRLATGDPYSGIALCAIGMFPFGVLAHLLRVSRR